MEELGKSCLTRNSDIAGSSSTGELDWCQRFRVGTYNKVYTFQSVVCHGGIETVHPWDEEILAGHAENVSVLSHALCWTYRKTSLNPPRMSLYFTVSSCC